MDRTALLRKGNPLRSDASWQFVLVEGIVALAIGLYILLAESQARRDIVLVIGLFLLVDGLSYAWTALRARGAVRVMSNVLLVRSGIGIATGLIVVVNRFSSFMGLDAARVVAAIGFIGMGLVTIVGVAMARDEAGLQLGAMVGAILLAAWGVVLLYQVAVDSFGTVLLGWAGIVVGVGLCAYALFRRQAASAPVAPSTGR